MGLSYQGKGISSDLGQNESGQLDPENLNQFSELSHIGLFQTQIVNIQANDLQDNTLTLGGGGDI